MRGGLGAMSSAAMAAQDAVAEVRRSRKRFHKTKKQRLTELPWGAVVFRGGFFRPRTIGFDEKRGKKFLHFKKFSRGRAPAHRLR